ncbi:MAG: response regulator transcription factor [Ignavibacteriae bacterium]|nr:response regulator transcription factor [Ignavibacteriota bacterium]
MQKTILVVDDEKDIIEMLRYNLEKEGYRVIGARDGKGALEQAQKTPDVIVLDIMMPEMDGWDVCRKLKQDPRTANIPTIFLTAKGSEFDEVLGLELGADDYVVKPISMRKLLARIRAVLRRRFASARVMSESQEIIQLDAVEINVPNYVVKVEGRQVSLTRKEFETLVYLATNRGRVVSRETLLDVVWGQNVHVVDRTVDVHISKIREKLGRFGEYIETVKGVGYRVRT